MIDLRTFTLFLAAAAVLIAAPGPDILYVISRGISGGRRAGLVSALGIGSGEVLQTLLAVLGLAALLQASLAAFLIVKYAGAGYLVYLGIRTIRERNGFALRQLDTLSPWGIFRQGVFTNLLNPKAVLFYVTFLPQFVNPLRGHAQLQLVVLGTTFALLDVVFLAGLAYSVDRVGAWLVSKPKSARRVKYASGTLLIGLGVRLALVEKN
jgi:threonine/homoserine/homoserine lactone efflux protein